MGYAIAEAALAEGHHVTLISGPVNLEAPRDAGNVGSWVAGPDAGGLDFSDGRLYVADGGLYIFTATGVGLGAH